MFGKGIELFKLFGFSVRADWTWLIIVVLVTWSLAAHVFPEWYPELTVTSYWTMGTVGAFLFFLSIVLHELAHSIIARLYGIPMKGITLFIFGGVAHMDREPPTAKSEFALAIAGPIASILIAGLSFGVFLISSSLSWPVEITGITGWLAWINLILVVFNMVPAFPLDGGRVLRSLIWYWQDDLKWATKVTSSIGSAFGFFLIFLGLFSLLGGALVGGIWMGLIGLFLYNAARMSYYQLLVQQALAGESLRRFMKRDPITVSPDLRIQDLVENYIYEYHHKMFPVTEDQKLIGCVTTADVKQISHNQWEQYSVREIFKACNNSNTISIHAEPLEALKQMNRNRISRLLVVDGPHLAGIITLKDLMQFLSLKIDLETDDKTPFQPADPLLMEESAHERSSPVGSSSK